VRAVGLLSRRLWCDADSYALTTFANGRRGFRKRDDRGWLGRLLFHCRHGRFGLQSRVVGHVEDLVQAGAQPGELGLELVHPVAVSHVLGEVMQAVDPVVQRARHQRERERHHGHGPERHSVDVEHGPVNVHRGQIAVAEHGRSHPDGQPDQE